MSRLSATVSIMLCEEHMMLEARERNQIRTIIGIKSKKTCRVNGCKREAIAQIVVRVVLHGKNGEIANEDRIEA